MTTTSTDSFTLAVNREYTTPSCIMFNFTIADDRQHVPLLGLHELCRALAKTDVDLEVILDTILLHRRAVRYDTEQAEANVG